MIPRKPIKLDEVEWDGLLLGMVRIMDKLLPMERILNSRLFQWFSAGVRRLNPCHSDENSLAWRIMCYLFPECWCCSGIRGFIYGIVFMFAVMGLWSVIV